MGIRAGRGRGVCTSKSDVFVATYSVAHEVGENAMGTRYRSAYERGYGGLLRA
jgi:hypothetical protein